MCMPKFDFGFKQTSFFVEATRITTSSPIYTCIWQGEDTRSTSYFKAYFSVSPPPSLRHRPHTHHVFCAHAHTAQAEKGKFGACDGKASAHVYNSCLMHLAKCARWREALAVFERMSAKGVTPNSFCLNATLDACAAAGEWKRCLSVLERAKSSGLEVNEISYNICIAACGSGKQWQKALELLREIEAAGRRIASETSPGVAPPAGERSSVGGLELTPTIGTYGATIKTLGMSGKWRESIEIFREAQSLDGGGEAGDELSGGNGSNGGILSPDVVTYTTLVAALGQNGRTAEARQIWEEMVASGVKPNVVTYHAMIAAHGNAAAAKALSTTRDRSAGASADAAADADAADAAATADGAAAPPPSSFTPPPRKADWADALRLFDEMPRNGITHTFTSYGVAITVAGQCGLWEEAIAMLERMRQEGRGREAGAGAAWAKPDGKPLAPNNYIYSAAMNACGINGQWEQALRQVFGELLVGSCRVFGFGRRVGSAAVAGGHLPACLPCSPQS